MHIDWPQLDWIHPAEPMVKRLISWKMVVMVLAQQWVPSNHHRLTLLPSLVPHRHDTFAIESQLRFVVELEILYEEKKIPNKKKKFNIAQPNNFESFFTGLLHFFRIDIFSFLYGKEVAWRAHEKRKQMMKRIITGCNYRNKTSIGDRCVVIAPINWCDAWWYGRKPAFWPPFTCMWRIIFGFSFGVFGGDVESSFFKLKFSGVASSGAESTSKSDSGELGRPFWFGELAIGILYDVFFNRGLLGDDSEPVSWSVSVDIRWRFVPTQNSRN